MIVLIWIFSFFSFLALLVGAFRDDYINLAIYTKTFLKMNSDAEETRKQKVQIAFDSLIATHAKKPDKEKVPPPEKSQGKSRPEKPKVYLNVTPHNNKFNLAVFFKKGEEKYKEALKGLLRSFLGAYTETFLQELTEKGQWLRGASKKLDPSKVVVISLKDLAKIPFSNRELVYKALKEGLQDHCLFEADRNRYLISIHYASQTVLAAALDDEQLASALIRVRTEKYQTGSRTLKSNQKTLVSNLYLEEEEIKLLFKAAGKDLESYASVLDVAVRKLQRTDLPKSSGLTDKELVS